MQHLHTPHAPLRACAQAIHPLALSGLSLMLTLGCAAAPPTSSTPTFKAPGAPEDAIKVQTPSQWLSDSTKTPRSVHMTWQHDPSSTITMQWSTEARLDYLPKVWAVPAKYTLDPQQQLRMPWSKQWVALGEGRTYETELLGKVIVPGKQVVWTVELTGLQSDTEYVYRVGTWESFEPTTGTFSGVELNKAHRFRTAPAKGSRAPFDLVFAGDSRGGTAKIRENMEHFSQAPALAWMFNGDMCPGGLQDQWEDWFDAMAPILHTKVLMPVQGNHELYANVYYEQFALPRQPKLPKDYIEHGWSIDLANVHITGLDSNTEGSVKAQSAWLEADLAAARADPDIDWLVIMSHHPAYSAGHHGSTSRMREQWVPIFDKYHVDFAFSGHDHSYERTYPLRANKIVKAGEGVVYVVAGGFFAPPYGIDKEWWTAKSTSGHVYNWLKVHFDGKKVSLEAWSGDGKQKLDSFELTRP